MTQKRQPKTPAPEVLDMVTTNEDELAVSQLGGTVLGFFKGLQKFLGEAAALERQAKSELEAARRLTPSTSAGEDVAIQKVVIAAADRNKEVETLWNPITQAFYRLHKTLTGARGRAFDANEETRKIGNRLHNDFVERKAREAREAEERDRRQKEQDAQAQRERELADAEAEAVKREKASPTLSDREEHFVRMVMGGTAPTVAAKTAGFKTPGEAAIRLMAEGGKVDKAIAARRQAETIRNQAAAQAQKPLDVQVEEVKPDVQRATGAKDTTRHSAEIVDADKLIAACVQGGHGIPWDILAVKPAAVNEHAKTLKEKINAWPGVRYKKETGVSR
jgi:hypothetical protein